MPVLVMRRILGLLLRTIPKSGGVLMMLLTCSMEILPVENSRRQPARNLLRLNSSVVFPRLQA